MDKHAPIIHKRIKGKACQWLSTEIKELMNNRDKALRKARKSKFEADFAEYKSSKVLARPYFQPPKVPKTLSRPLTKILFMLK